MLTEPCEEQDIDMEDLNEGFLNLNGFAGLLKGSGVASNAMSPDTEVKGEINGANVVIGQVQFYTDAQKAKVTPIDEDGNLVEKEVRHHI